MSVCSNGYGSPSINVASAARPPPPFAPAPWWPSVDSRGIRLLLHLGQHPGHEGQQLLQRVEARHLPGHQMLDPTVIACRRPRGVDTKLHHKDPIARQRRLGWGHRYVLRGHRLHDILNALFTWKRYTGAPVHEYS